MAIISFAPNTKAKSADVNANFAGLANGSNDTAGNSLQLSRQLTMSNFVSSGLTIATSSNLSSTIVTGVAMVNGKYVNPSTTTRTFTASKDTYVDLKDDGTFAYVEVANGATTGMTLTTNSDGTPALRIAKVVTSGSAITTVTQNGVDSLGYITYNQNPFGPNQLFFPSYQNSWIDFDTTTWGPSVYFKDKSGRVQIEGLAKNGTATGGTVIFTLPVGFRPSRQLMFSVFSNAVAARLNIAINGQITCDTNVNALWVSLNMNFMAAN